MVRQVTPGTEATPTKSRRRRNQLPLVCTDPLSCNHWKNIAWERGMLIGRIGFFCMQLCSVAEQVSGRLQQLEKSRAQSWCAPLFIGLRGFPPLYF